VESVVVEGEFCNADAGPAAPGTDVVEFVEICEGIEVVLGRLDRGG
jgi:hypothetical protein